MRRAHGARRQEQLAPDSEKRYLALWNISSVEKLDLGRVSIPRRNRYIFCRGGIPRGERKDAKGAKFGEDILTADLRRPANSKAHSVLDHPTLHPPLFGGQVYDRSLRSTHDKKKGTFYFARSKSTPSGEHAPAGHRVLRHPLPQSTSLYS